MLRSPRHPYQVTTLPQPHLHARNPWSEKPESSTNSSCGSRSGRTKNTASHSASEWLMTRNQTLSHQGPLLNQQPIQPIIVSNHGRQSTISTPHDSSGGASSTGGIESCGGQCIACETFCYYFLQVIFIAGILTGIALTIAGSVLHGNQKEGDLVVLMYIGVLLVLVCILLLSVHCCVRRNVRERKRALRMALMDGSRRIVHPTPGDFADVPVRDFRNPDPHYRNSFVETAMNEYETSEISRPALIPNPTFSCQYRQGSLMRSTNPKINACDRRLLPPAAEASSDCLIYDWGNSNRNFHRSANHRSFR